MNPEYKGIRANCNKCESVRDLGLFSGDAKEFLLSEGYSIYSLSGTSIRALKAKGDKFWSKWHEEYPLIEDLTSINGEVAINPREIFIEGSNFKSLEEQDVTIRELSERLTQKNKGIQALVGELADYSELFFIHKKRTGTDLFSSKYARTTDSAFSNPIFVGGSMGDNLGIVYWQPVFDCYDFFVAPLIIPVK